MKKILFTLCFFFVTTIANAGFVTGMLVGSALSSDNKSSQSGYKTIYINEKISKVSNINNSTYFRSRLHIISDVSLMKSLLRCIKWNNKTIKINEIISIEINEDDIIKVWYLIKEN